MVHLGEDMKAVIDGGAIAVAVSTVAGWLPSMAALFTVLWLGMQMVMNWSKFSAAVRRILRKGKD